MHLFPLMRDANCICTYDEKISIFESTDDCNTTAETICEYQLCTRGCEKFEAFEEKNMKRTPSHSGNG